MLLDPRLLAVADFVPSGASLADIGTDHGKLPLWLLAHGRARLVIAADKNPAPLDMARRTLARAQLAVELRLGDGLAALRPGEAEVIALAGMGGELMAAILDADVNAVLPATLRLVLQPQNEAATVRRWLYGHAWHLAAERLVLSRGRLYTVMAAEPGARPMPPPLSLLLGVCLDDDPLYPRHCAALLAKHRRVLGGLLAAAHVDRGRVDALRALLAQLEAAHEQSKSRHAL